jgi:hypothetical protein
MKFLDWMQLCLDNNYDIDWYSIYSYEARIDNAGWL